MFPNPKGEVTIGYSARFEYDENCILQGIPLRIISLEGSDCECLLPTAGLSALIFRGLYILGLVLLRFVMPDVIILNHETSFRLFSFIHLRSGDIIESRKIAEFVQEYDIFPNSFLVQKYLSQIRHCFTYVKREMAYLKIS